MHQPRPYGLHGNILSAEDGAAVDALVRRLTNIKSTGKLDGLKLVRTLPGGGVAIATDMGGVLRAIVQNPVQHDEPPEPGFDGTAGVNIPMLYSGVVVQGVLPPGQPLPMDLTRDARRRLAQYKTERMGSIAERQSLQRFVIEYSPRHSEFLPKTETAYVFTQYTALRPTWFSGAMAAVVQVVGGYGRQDLRALPNTPIERAQMVLPPGVAQLVRKQLGTPVLPGYSGFPPASGQIQYDYKFQETHGVSFGSDRKPWLVRISSKGVYAMPLPLVPATTTAAFRRYVEDVGDKELEWLLDVFGGMPSGEGFPGDVVAFEAWRRAGVIIKLADMREFYQCMAYSSACGWAFSTNGAEAFNTCYEFGDDGLQRGNAYKIKLSFGKLPNHGMISLQIPPGDQDGARMLGSYISALYQKMGNKPEHLAIKYKLRHVDMAKLLARARSAVQSNSPLEVEIDYWDALEASPISVAKASVSKVGSGILWAPGPPKAHPQIKFPEPSLQGCISHDFGRLEDSPVPDPAPRCDTIMYGYYVDNSLKVVKYFRDERTYQAEVEDNYEDCMIVGSWQRTVTQGPTSLMGNFYTTDIDERKAAAPVTTVTITEGRDLGYDTQPFFAFDEIFSMVGSMWRNRYFQHKVNEEKSDGYGLMVAVCVPYMERSALLHAKSESTGGGVKSESLSLYFVEDPNRYRIFTHDFIWAWVGGDSSGKTATAKDVSPYPKDGNPVWVKGYSYAPYTCSDFADQGDWVGGLPRDYTWLVHPNRNEWRHSGGGGAPKIKEYHNVKESGVKKDGELMISIIDSPKSINKNPDSGYFIISPNEIGDIFRVDAIKNSAGNAIYANTSEVDTEAPKQRKRIGFSRLANHRSAHHFIGVIHE